MNLRKRSVIGVMAISMGLGACGYVLAGEEDKAPAKGEKTKVDKPLDEVGKLRKHLIEKAPASIYGLSVKKHPSLRAIHRLEKIASVRAVEALGAFLTTYGKDWKLKQHALTALGRIATAEGAAQADSKGAIAAITAFEKWTVKTRLTPPAFSLTRPMNYGIGHFNDHPLKPRVTATDGDGKTWAVFRWRRYGDKSLWATRLLDKKAKTWSPPILLGQHQLATPDEKLKLSLEVVKGVFKLTRGGLHAEFSLAAARKDTDNDGLPDLVEMQLGTDDRLADSDHDGVPDGKDANPLTTKHDAASDEIEIRQAVFSMQFATGNSQDAIVIVTKPWGKPKAKDLPHASQEYRGFSGIVLRAPQVRKGFVNVTSMSVKLTSKTTATVRVSDYEGPGAGATYRATVQKVRGKWVVTAFRLGLIR